MTEKLKAPFPYFGGKSSVSDLVWERFGNPLNYVEPFFGSGAVLLSRPTDPGIETVNDIDGLIANFWRAVKLYPSEVAGYADWPVNENDLHARHSWLVGVKDSLAAQLEGHPEWCDPKIAGWWVWGMCCWIGGGFCSGEGPWLVADGKLVHLGDAGRGVNRQLVHLGKGRGVNRKRVHLGNAGRGVNRQREDEGIDIPLLDWMQRLSDRLKNVRVCCGDWSRVCGPTPTIKQGLTAVFLDPPYHAGTGRDMGCYTKDDGEVSTVVRQWAITWGSHKDMRIAICGYEGEHEMPKDWECVAWIARGGYGSRGAETIGRANSKKERIWFSPNCLRPELNLL